MLAPVNNNASFCPSIHKAAVIAASAHLQLLLSLASAEPNEIKKAALLDAALVLARSTIALFKGFG